ncbi:MAG: bifunctional UDP-N-acetylglucosamine diphosphorylase/glucosamine-1-phosphate N-acetyltransferase GlmU [Acidobacteriaceae bacterium]|nr:bifunctional UDP-N-acetylglucosamine diphosphorylase/glucosamine-1-phosphate N-acetyltransferase GlmU [Acidobacteriaceae bacterium]MBV9443952.1 bifunctional UDP-N-acetylglucosamine diphosphorylase/glucosamine-1-phosphate N-acetyltransferase GlmU [Acidobacteriaceae bacterium]
MNKDITVIILAAGLGTRMKSRKAKVLHEAGGDTLLNNIIRIAKEVTSPDNIIAVVGHQAEQVRESVKIPGVRFALQAEQRGTGHAVISAREVAGSHEGKLMILNGDGPLLRSETLFRLRAESDEAPGGSIVTTELQDPTGYGRVIRDASGRIAAVVEQKAGTPEQLAIKEVNPGLYCFDAAAFWKHVGEIRPDNPAREYYLTDMVEILTRHGYPISPLLIEDETELLGINTRVELAIADRILRTRKVNDVMLSGVTIEFPETVIVDADVEIGPDSIIEPNAQLRGSTRIGSNCRIGSGAILRDCDIGDNVWVLPYVVAESSSVGNGAHVGPFSRLRMQASAGENTHIGNFVELKKTKLGAGSKASHLAYLGDSVIGSQVNIGAGTITCNYDGVLKHLTNIGDGAFVGSNSTLVAPLKVGSGSYVAAGSTITEDVEEDALAVGRSRQVDKPGWARKRRAHLQETKG